MNVLQIICTAENARWVLVKYN